MSTLKVDTILKRTGTGTITVGQSGDTVALPTVTLTTALPVAQGGTGGTSFSAAGLANTPAFKVYDTGDQSVADNSYVKATFGTEEYDTDSAFASNKFTVPSGAGGKYLFYGSFGFNSNAVNDISYADVKLYKNGSGATASPQQFMYNDTTGFFRSGVFAYTGTLTLAAGDYIEVYGRIDDINGSSMVFASRSFAGHKLIGV